MSDGFPTRQRERVNKVHLDSHDIAILDIAPPPVSCAVLS
jgi:hypothetical protein